MPTALCLTMAHPGNTAMAQVTANNRATRRATILQPAFMQIRRDKSIQRAHLFIGGVPYTPPGALLYARTSLLAPPRSRSSTAFICPDEAQGQDAVGRGLLLVRHGDRALLQYFKTVGRYEATLGQPEAGGLAV